jgi:addiction module HigA family antidote
VSVILSAGAVTTDTAIRLACALGTSEQFWMGLQLDHDLEEERKARSEHTKED